ncbi:MAG: FmdB family zinc ribbon protein [Candidatus Eiseniibacteriota bacterium]
MPTYVYRCKKCTRRFELFHGITDETVKRCPRCRAKAERVPAGGAGIIFKGSGFYITDYRSKSYKDKARQDKPGETQGGGAGASSSGPSGGSSGSAGGSSPGKSGGTTSGKSDGSSSSKSGGS